MDITQDDSLHTTFSSLDLGTTFDEIDCSTDSPLKATALFYRNTSLCAMKPRGPPPPLPTTPKPKVAVTRSTVEDFLLMEYSFRLSGEISVDGTTTDSYSDGNSSIRSEDYRVTCLTHAPHSETSLITFDRKSPMRIGRRKRYIQRSLPTMPPCTDNMGPGSCATATSCSTVPRPFRVRLKRFIQKKIRKIFS